MEISTAVCLILIVGLLVGGFLMGKEIDLRKPIPAPPLPCPPLSDVGRAITALEIQLERLQDHYADDQDSDVLAEISKINTVLAGIATQSSGNICKCGGKKS